MVDYGWKKGGLIEYISERSDTYYWGRQIHKPIKKNEREFIIYDTTELFKEMDNQFKKLMHEEG